MKFSQSPIRNRASKRGFALIVTLSLMILLTVIAVGLLTLSSISLRATSQGAAQAVANANAKLALMIAIGDLQRALGPDQRISASASSVMTKPAQPNVVGAWDGFGWTPPTGNAPSLGEKAQKFRTWLISTANADASLAFNYPGIELDDDAIWLNQPGQDGILNPGAENESNPTMQAGRVPIKVGKSAGGFAWMVSDNSTAVSLNLQQKNSVELAQNIANRTAATAPRPDVISDELKKLTTLDNRSSVISLQTAVLAVGSDNANAINARSQSLTTTSLGLLTDPVSGGLKVDLTPLMEGNGPNPMGAADSDTPYYQATSGAPSWAYLRDHYQKYRNLTNVASGKPSYSLDRKPDINPRFTPRGGLNPAPSTEALLPVLAKVQIVFSLVTHYSHIGDRVQALNEKGVPKLNINHAVPHLVYDPVVTLYNPYDVQLDVSRMRIRIWDPPVGFQFQKHDLQKRTNPWLRGDFPAQYHGLARFQIKNEKNNDARKYFTLIMENMTSEGARKGKLTLLPGEVKVFAPRIESRWTWGYETEGGYTPKTFFDWDANNDMGNLDRRRNPPNPLGVESISTLDYRGGFQTDHLSYGGGRPADSKYDFENGVGTLGAGWVSLRMTDDITVNCKPQRCVTDDKLPDFQVDILAGVNAGTQTDVSGDLLRTYKFRLGNVPTEMSTTGSAARPITRRLPVAGLLQSPTDKVPAGKTPFAIFTMSAKTTKDSRDDSKAWVQNNLVTSGADHDTRRIGNAVQSYDLRLDEMTDFTSFPAVAYDSQMGRGYFGAIAEANDGVSVVPMYRVPLAPAASLGDWIASNLISSSQFPRVNYALGNSFASPMISSNDITQAPLMTDTARMLDHSYLLNASLWDRYFFSSAADYSSDAFESKRSKAQVLDGFFTGQEAMLNSRLVPYLSGDGDAQALATSFAGMTPDEFSKKFAGNAEIKGAFNINSDSVDAWRSVLSSLRDASVVGYDGNVTPVPDKTAFVRTGLPIAGSADEANSANSVNVLGQIRWAGFRTLDDDKIEELATAIVKEIRARGVQDSAPSLCLADFVNRRIGTPSSLHALKGILQTAIDETSINTQFLTRDSNPPINGNTLAANRTKNLPNKDALSGFTADGAAPMLSQGDLLTGLAPFITARGDTFTIRAYGEVRNAAGTVVEARSWCEATVQRVPEFVDSTNAADTAPSALSLVNQAFGRRFTITSFRWLNSSEI